MESLLQWYQNLPLGISPVLLDLGFIQIRWYSLGYIFTFITAGELAKWRIRHKEASFPIEASDIYDAYLYTIIGVILGGRLGYLLFYDTAFFFTNPLEAILPFSRTANGLQFSGISGMSYHGGFIGFVMSCYIFNRVKKFPFWQSIDLWIPGIALGYTFGRLGNFMNAELYGRITEKAWGMYFINPSTNLPFEQLRHPSQLYEAFVEGLLAFIILWVLRKRLKSIPGMLALLYVMLYSLGRYAVEFLRQPDEIFKDPGETIGSVWLFMSMGQVLSLVMILFATVMYFSLMAGQQKISKK